MSSRRYSLGLDFGTSGVRALIVDASDGRELGVGVSAYAHGEDGVLLDPRDPNLARQHPADYHASMEAAIAEALAQAGEIDRLKIVGIGVDATGSTPIPVNREGTPLGLLPEFEGNLDAMAWLWKDHTAAAEAEEITALGVDWPYLQPIGGRYSSEWFWSKILRCARTAPEVFGAAYSWVEFADYMPAFLSGNTEPLTLKRGVCAAGHKALFREEWGGLPDERFLSCLHPRLAELRGRLFSETCASDQVAGYLSPDLAERYGLPAGIPIAVGAIDAHMGAVGAGIAPGTLVKIMGTSTCDIMVGAPGQAVPDIPGVCGVVYGSVIPGFYGVEAGQPAVGDLFNWVTRLTGQRHDVLNAEAQRLAPGESGLLSLDWNNGNRSVLVDANLTGLIVGQTLNTTPAEIYRAAIEATAFGSLTIIRRIEECGVKVDRIINCGGIAEKSPLTMQIYSDVTNRPMYISRSSQTPALGAAMFGAVIGGVYKTVDEAAKKMAGLRDRSYQPNPDAVKVYAELYSLYEQLADAFGGVRQSSMGDVMKKLIAIRDRVRGLN